MKIEITEDSMTLTPEDAEELQALHNMGYRGVTGVCLVGELPTDADNIQYRLKFGPDYIKESMRIKAESERQAKRPSTRLFKALRAAWNASNI